MICRERLQTDKVVAPVPNSAFCRQLTERIEKAYAESGNSLGWRLLASPAGVLDGADVAFIGLNPGGSIRPVAHPEFCLPHGSAYVDEVWGRATEAGTSPLQTQVRILFGKLGVSPDEVLAGNLVPFRSPNWNSLKQRELALRFGELLWADILSRANPRLVIGMGHAVSQPLCRILRAREVQQVSVGWGTVTALKAQTPHGSLVILPHLSRFGVVSRERSAEALRFLFKDFLASR